MTQEGSVKLNTGDRIRATAGVCPGHFGIVTGIKRDADTHRNIIYEVTYDSGLTDTIFGYMIQLAEKGFELEYEMDSD